MATTEKVKVKVEELSKFGFKANGRYVGLSKHLSESDKTRIVPGSVFEAEFYVADSGKEYLNKILSVSIPHPNDAVPPAVPMPADSERAKRFTPKFQKKEIVTDGEKMTKADWNAKDRNMMIGGRSHDAAVMAAAIIPSQMLQTTEEALKVYRELLEGMLAIAEEVK